LVGKNARQSFISSQRMYVLNGKGNQEEREKGSLCRRKRKSYTALTTAGKRKRVVRGRIKSPILIYGGVSCIPGKQAEKIGRKPHERGGQEMKRKLALCCGQWCSTGPGKTKNQELQFTKKRGGAFSGGGQTVKPGGGCRRTAGWAGLFYLARGTKERGLLRGRKTHRRGCSGRILGGSTKRLKKVKTVGKSFTRGGKKEALPALTAVSAQPYRPKDKKKVLEGREIEALDTN